MKSESKVKIPQTTLCTLCSTYLGHELAASREFEDGWFNTIHLLELADGSRTVLKVSPAPDFTVMRYEHDILSVEVAVHRRLAAAGLRVPTILADNHAGDLIGHPWFVMDFLEGMTLTAARKTLPPDALATLDRQVAAQTAAVHHIRGTRFGRWHEDSTASGSWAESFSAMVEDLLADAEDKKIRLPRPAGWIRTQLASAVPALDNVNEARLVLWDLHDGNIMVRENPPELAAFLDTDRAVWADPLFDFCFRSLTPAPAGWLSAYEQAAAALGDPDCQRSLGAPQRLAWYEAYLALVMFVECAYRGFGLAHRLWARQYCAGALRKLQQFG